MAKEPITGSFDQAAETTERKEFEMLLKRFPNPTIREIALDQAGIAERDKDKVRKSFIEEEKAIQDTMKDLKYGSPEFNQGQNKKLEDIRIQSAKDIATINNKLEIALGELTAKQYKFHITPIDETKLLDLEPEEKQEEVQDAAHSVETEEEVEETVPPPKPEAELETASVEPSYFYDFNRASEPSTYYEQESSQAVQPEMDYPEQQL